MTAIRHLIQAEPRIFSRVREQRQNVLWSEKVALTPEDLDWIVSSGPTLKVSADGPVKAGGFRFSPDVVRQTTQFDSETHQRTC